MSSALSDVVPFHVQRQVIGPGESPVTQPALKRPVAGVFAEVPGQLVGSGKLPTAPVPIALVRFLARVRPKMRLEVRTLCVRFAASRVSARVVGRRLFRSLGPPIAADRAAFRRRRPVRRGRRRCNSGRRGRFLYPVFGRRRRRCHHGGRVRGGRHGRLLQFVVVVAVG